MKKCMIALLAAGFLGSATAADFSGTYQCHIADHSDGAFDATLVLTANPDATFSDSGYASYNLTLHVPGMPYDYEGMIAARGNDLGVYFESVGEKKDPNDRGVGIGTVIVDKNKAGINTTRIHKFYYEKAYKGKTNYGFEHCVKTK